MALVPFKKLLRFLQKKCDKHLKIDKKDLSRVAKFVSHNGNELHWHQFLLNDSKCNRRNIQIFKEHYTKA